jgi:type II secretory pathway pseudopilin PulG
MSALAVVLIVLAVLVVVLAIAGYVVVGRRRRAQRDALHAETQEADRQLARAHAEDKGWERSGLEAAARRAYAERHGAEPSRLVLVQVVDRPGVEEDEAVFDADGERLVLGRQGGEWVAAG